MLTPQYAFVALVLAGTLPATSLRGNAQEASLNQCKQWQDQIDHYSKLRKRGGNAREIERWKQTRRTYEDKFKDAACRTHGKSLKK